MKKNNYTFLGILLMTFASGCGGKGKDGHVALQIENARGPAGVAALKVQVGSENELTHVTKFKVTITGEGIDPAVTATAEESASQMELLGIPAGDNRSILIEAFNSAGTVIRRRKIDGIEISPGVVTPITTSLNTIPLVLNLKQGGVVLARNFHVLGFGEPGGSIRVNAQSASQSISLNESIGGNPIMVSPSISSGLFDFTPATPLVGKQTITVVDEESGESSSLEIYVLNGRDLPGRRIVSAAGLGPSIVIGSGLGGVKTGNFPRVLRALSHKTQASQNLESNP